MGFISLVALVCLSLVNPVYTQPLTDINSWTDAVITLSSDLTGAYHADKACIIRLENGNYWEPLQFDSRTIVLKGSEGANIAEYFRNEDLTAFESSDIQVGGVLYTYEMHEVKEDGTLLVGGKLENHGAISMQSANTVIVIAHTKEGGNPHYTNIGVEACISVLKHYRF
ncbi:profilin-like [Antedon mediterranea]|uniref:profilin-like n=1 Tax=Antedon mediterranea TaxID=105859 RepID=UPI003AF6E29E